MFAVYFVIFQPFKVTNPNDQRFDASQFRFEDYPSSTELAMFLWRLFRTEPKSKKVDEVMNKAGAFGEANPVDKNSYSYSYDTHWHYSGRRRFLNKQQGCCYCLG